MPRKSKKGRKEYAREYRQTSKNKGWRKEYELTPKRKDECRIWRQTSSRYKSYRKRYMKEYKRKRIEMWREFLFSLEYTTRCSRCGYNRCISAIEFHHINPEEKKFNISNIFVRSYNATNIILLLEELEKCEVLCANCHRELHDKEDK